jgi:glyoxylase-like metal-dependent hydrolase (beta-lactamase superfamily II)
MIHAASQAKIEIHSLRRNISVLEGSGRNIAVLTGKDGKLLIDAGFTVSKPRISPALKSLSTDPITRLINTHWHVDHTDGNAWLHAEGKRSRRMKIPRSTYALRLASMTGATRFHLPRQ